MEAHKMAIKHLNNIEQHDEDERDDHHSKFSNLSSWKEEA